MKKKDNTLTKVEFQVMSILWDINHSACAWDIIERWDHSRTARCARESDSYCCLHIAIYKPWRELEKPQKTDKKKSVQSL